MKEENSKSRGMSSLTRMLDGFSLGVRLGYSTTTLKEVFQTQTKRLSHTYVWGEERKSCLVNMASQDISNGVQIVFCASEDTVNSLLAAVPQKRLEEIILLDFSEPEKHLPGFVAITEEIASPWRESFAVYSSQHPEGISLAQQLKAGKTVVIAAPDIHAMENSTVDQISMTIAIQFEELLLSRIKLPKDTLGHFVAYFDGYMDFFGRRLVALLFRKCTLNNVALVLASRSILPNLPLSLLFGCDDLDFLKVILDNVNALIIHGPSTRDIELLSKLVKANRKDLERVPKGSATLIMAGETKEPVPMTIYIPSSNKQTPGDSKRFLVEKMLRGGVLMSSDQYSAEMSRLGGDHTTFPLHASCSDDRKETLDSRPSAPEELECEPIIPRKALQRSFRCRLRFLGGEERRDEY